MNGLALRNIYLHFPRTASADAFKLAKGHIIAHPIQIRQAFRVHRPRRQNGIISAQKLIILCASRPQRYPMFWNPGDYFPCRSAHSTCILTQKETTEYRKILSDSYSTKPRSYYFQEEIIRLVFIGRLYPLIMKESSLTKRSGVDT